MNEVRGMNRGSYIYGRSVHNIRIERLWVDVTRGFGKKWKDLFHLLETRYGLNVDNERHLWLLHHLFLHRTQHDIDVWIGSWNHHTISSRTQTYQTPTVMFQQGVIQHGFQGLFPESVNESREEVYAAYGVDWDDIENRNIVAHHHQHNPTSDNSRNFFDADTPEEMSHVEVPEVQDSLSIEGVSRLDNSLSALSYFSQGDISSLTQIWVEASNFLCSLG
ncbi:hypothetical protein C8R41DRAFT_758488 [Lentinula lateritia]|uniref:Integrase core domain-containing protein n=1 Tax=Lentinula lateritia TaxID=40482 RepID=A0ABQ8VNY1_9AGAR|nr:hypothetical protein C8R41DRAFT_758488 [Lentinula lateritia]